MSEDGLAVLRDPARLSALQALDLLDSPAEEAFDRLTTLASTVLHTPAAMVTLVDAHRQFFKSCVGLPEPWRARRQTPLSHSFCKYVVASRGPLVVADARSHPLLHDSPAIRDLGCVAYLGVPLVVASGQAVGTLCVCDAVPRTWTEREITVLQTLAASVMSEIALHSQRQALTRLVQERTAALEQANAALRAEATEHRLTMARLLQYNALLDKAHVLVRDLGGVITFWNQGAEQFYGWSHEEAVGQVSSELLKTQFPEPIECILAALERTGNWQGVLVHARRDGTRVTVASHWALHRDVYGAPALILEVNNDVTAVQQAREALQESERRYRNLFETAAVSIWEEDFSAVLAYLASLQARGVDDMRGYFAAHPEAVARAAGLVRVLDVNAQSLKLFGAGHKEELMGSLPKLFLPESLGAFQEELLALSAGEPYFEVEARVCTLQGVPKDVLLSIVFPYDTGCRRVPVSITDITTRKRAEVALVRAREDLEARVAARTRELQLANAQLREVDRLKSEFVATMSHELRTPLNAILGFTEILLQGLPGELNAEQHKQLTLVYSSAEHLLHLINDILDLSRLEAGKMEVFRERFPLADVLTEVTQLLAPLVAQKSLSLRTEVPPGPLEVCTDRKKLFQVLLNLVSNAVKFTERGEVCIACRLANGSLEVRVTDTGVGIKPENMALLFTAFRQVDGSARRRYEGTGLGLHLCQRLVSLLGGQIRAESTYGRGSTFTLTLPVA